MSGDQTSSQGDHERAGTRNERPICLRVLCLHDGNSNVPDLSSQLEALGERLYEKHGIDLVYVSSPLLNRASTETSNPSEDVRKPAGRVWWQEDEGKYNGLDASLFLLRQVWASMPIWGILAVGDGGAVAAFLPLLPVDPMPSFCIFIHGTTLLEEDEKLIENLPCLHIVGSNPRPATERLLHQFGGKVHQGGKTITKQSMNAIGRFLVDQKKQLRKNVDGSGNILALQNQLYFAEQEAASIVAEHIAQNPPSALMAVISPRKVVGGWHGKKRRQPNEEGGGAPCPSEFLLNRENRGGDANGPSRIHPTAATEAAATEGASY